MVATRAAHAGEPQLFKDIVPGAQGSSPSKLVQIGDTVALFTTNYTSSGFALAWLSALDGGADREQVLASFRDSPQFRARAETVVAQGCLQ